MQFCLLIASSSSLLLQFLSKQIDWLSYSFEFFLVLLLQATDYICLEMDFMNVTTYKTWYKEINWETFWCSGLWENQWTWTKLTGMTWCECVVFFVAQLTLGFTSLGDVWTTMLCALAGRALNGWFISGWAGWKTFWVAAKIIRKLITGKLNTETVDGSIQKGVIKI